MARSISIIKQEMIAAKAAESALAGLTSTSQTAIWNLIFFICAVAINAMETLFDVFKAEVEARSVQIPTGTLPWYASESKKFQYGDTLVFQDGFVKYATIDATKQIVALSAANIVNGNIFLRVAKVVGGVALKLDTPEYNAFTAYWLEKRFAGASITIISGDADLINISYRIKINAQILALDGSKVGSPTVFPVNDAINSFLQTFQSENFAIDMQIMRLTDAIQSVSGVLNAVPITVQAKKSDSPTYTNILTDPNQTYASYAGYLKANTITNTYVV